MRTVTNKDNDKTLKKFRRWITENNTLFVKYGIFEKSFIERYSNKGNKKIKLVHWDANEAKDYKGICRGKTGNIELVYHSLIDKISFRETHLHELVHAFLGSIESWDYCLRTKKYYAHGPCFVKMLAKICDDLEKNKFDEKLCEKILLYLEETISEENFDLEKNGKANEYGKIIWGKTMIDGCVAHKKMNNQKEKNKVWKYCFYHISGMYKEDNKIKASRAGRKGNSHLKG